MLALGERPGKLENIRGQVFCGPTGEESDTTYWPRAGLYRGLDFFIGNVVRCWAFANRTPSPAEIRSCAGHFLPTTFARVQPEYLVLLGSSACSIADEPIRLDMHHGRPRYGSVMGGLWEGWIWPSYHPAAGLHDGKNMTWLLEDFESLGKWLRGDWWPVRPPNKQEVDYGLAETVTEFDRYIRPRVCSGRDGLVDLACDTENHGLDKFSVQLSTAPQTARMMLAGKNESSLRALRSMAREKADQIVWVFHNAPHDMDELDRYNVGPILNWRDTMQEAYHQCNLPQGLKPLAYRTLGATMRSWEDVVWPASVRAITRWMRAAVALSTYDKTVVMKTVYCRDCGHRHKTGKCKKCGCESVDMTNVRTEEATTTAATILTHVLRYTTAEEQNVDTPYHPWKKLAAMKEEGLRGKVAGPGEWDELEEMLGPVPVLGIGNCELPEAVTYGCSDSDYTLQVANELTRRRGELMTGTGALVVDEEDWDV